ncbi:MAG: aminoglycoside 6-adenylyltransferase [Anaerolineae bacterium]|nr:MAG: aminoglycoside 6-adenylyltransferase [Anaerolineae bacterium]
MRSEPEMFDLILDTARRDAHPRGDPPGSRANPDAARPFQDFDIVYIVTDVAPFRCNLDWIQRFGADDRADARRDGRSAARQRRWLHLPDAVHRRQLSNWRTGDRTWRSSGRRWCGPRRRCPPGNLRAVIVNPTERTTTTEEIIMRSKLRIGALVLLALLATTNQPRP